MLLVEIQKQKQLLCLLWFVLEKRKEKEDAAEAPWGNRRAPVGRR